MGQALLHSPSNYYVRINKEKLKSDTAYLVLHNYGWQSNIVTPNIKYEFANSTNRLMWSFLPPWLTVVPLQFPLSSLHMFHHGYWSFNPISSRLFVAFVHNMKVSHYLVAAFIGLTCLLLPSYQFQPYESTRISKFNIVIAFDSEMELTHVKWKHNYIQSLNCTFGVSFVIAKNIFTRSNKMSVF
jgi:hypothetical protein